VEKLKALRRAALSARLRHGVMQERRAALREPVKAGAQGLIVVLGDSYTQGSGLPDGRFGAWPTLLGAATGRPVHLDGLGSTGLTTAGFFTGQPMTFRERLTDGPLLRLRPATLIVQGGQNDASFGVVDEVRVELERLLRLAQEVPEVVVVGPAVVPVVDVAATKGVDGAMADATAAAGRTYVRLIGQPLTFGADRTHPDTAGQHLIAEVVAAALR
jgi:lysophospholipase L1-like esterase